VNIFTDRIENQEKMGKNIPVPAIERLTKLYTVITGLKKSNKKRISSTELESLTGIQAHSIRKDLSLLASVKSSKDGYSTESLEELLSMTFGFERKRKICIAGLDMHGMAILNNPDSALSGFEIAAGFDSSINRLEMITTKVPLYLFYEIEEKVRQLEIEFAILAVDSESAQKTADRLAAGGIKGILNFSPVILEPKQGLLIRNIYLLEELRLLSALLAQGFATGNSEQYK
jgi:redox-sensing transcriptional repressor